MYMHLGNNYIIPLKDIIAILNIVPPLSEDIKDIIEIAKIEKNLINIGEKKKEKSLVICEDKVFISPMSSVTLYKRASSQYKGE